MAKLAEILQTHTIRGDLYESLEGNRVRCVACAHRCTMPDGATGICRVRFNRGGELRVPFGYVSGAQCDPIEKKPFFHVLPGGLAYSYGMLGCNLHCGYCQNWITSQILQDPDAAASPMRTTPEELVAQARSQNAAIMVSTYNEPLITAEWNAAILKLARDAGLRTGYVSNGYASPEALQYVRPWLDLCKVDLKTFEDRQYRRLGGRLQPVLDTIRSLHAAGIWVEVVTLLVPGFNDSQKELTQMSEFLAGVSADIPWHVTAFHRDYRMTEYRDAAPEDLLRAVHIGRSSGLRFVYAGNLPGQLEKCENTCCPACGASLIERCGFRVRIDRLGEHGTCTSCSGSIPGVWTRC